MQPLDALLDRLRPTYPLRPPAEASALFVLSLLRDKKLQSASQLRSELVRSLEQSAKPTRFWLGGHRSLTEFLASLAAKGYIELELTRDPADAQLRLTQYGEETIRRADVPALRHQLAIG